MEMVDGILGSLGVVQVSHGCPRLVQQDLHLLTHEHTHREGGREIHSSQAKQRMSDMVILYQSTTLL